MLEAALADRRSALELVRSEFNRLRRTKCTRACSTMMMQDHLENLHHLLTYFHQLVFHHLWDVSEEMLAIEDKPKLEIWQ